MTLDEFKTMFSHIWELDAMEWEIEFAYVQDLAERTGHQMYAEAQEYLLHCETCSPKV